jgi:hypothetical protein
MRWAGTMASVMAAQEVMLLEIVAKLVLLTNRATRPYGLSEYWVELSRGGGTPIFG